MNGVKNLDKTYSEYSIVPTNDQIKLWRSKVKVAAGRRGGEGIYVYAGSSKSTFYSFKM